MAVISTPSPKQRRVPHCRTCGSPMRGHKKAGCLPNSTQTSPMPTQSRTRLKDLEGSLERLQLDIQTEDRPQTKQRRRSSMMKQPSLESLTSSAINTLELVLTTQKQQSEEPHTRSKS